MKTNLIGCSIESVRICTPGNRLSLYGFQLCFAFAQFLGIFYFVLFLGSDLLNQE